MHSYPSLGANRTAGTIALVLLVALACVPHVASILINPTLEASYKFPKHVGQTDYAYFVEHPPVLSLDEAFIAVLTRPYGTDIYLNVLYTNTNPLGPDSTTNMTALLAANGVTVPPVKIEMHALPEDNFILNYLWFEGPNTISRVMSLSYSRTRKTWTMTYVMQESKYQPTYRKLAHLRPTSSLNFPWNLEYPLGDFAPNCTAVLWWMENDIREFVLCKSQKNWWTRIEYKPTSDCFQYVIPWHNDLTDVRNIYSVARLDATGILALVDTHYLNGTDAYQLVQMSTSQCLPPVVSTSPGSPPSADKCTQCLFECLGTANGQSIPFIPGNEAPAILVPDTNTGRLTVYSCTNSTRLEAESYPSWMNISSSTEVADCLFTLFEVASAKHDVPLPPPVSPVSPPTDSHGPVAASPTAHHARSTERIPQHAFSHRPKNRNAFSPVPSSHSSPIPAPFTVDPPAPFRLPICYDLPLLHWITEPQVGEPAALVLAANRTVRFSYNGDLLYATHFTRDGISSVSIIDVSNTGAFEQGSLPLDTKAPEGPLVNSFSDDVDVANQFLYVVGFYWDYRTRLSTPGLFKYDVSPRGQPSFVSQLYIDSQSGTTPTANYMLPFPNYPGVAVVAAPREIIIKQVTASSLNLQGQVITYQYTSAEVLDLNVVRPVISADGKRVLVFCQTLGLSHSNSILSAYVFDIVLTPLNNTGHHKPPHSNDPHTPAPDAHAPPVGHDRLSNVVRQHVAKKFGSNTRIEMDQFEESWKRLHGKSSSPTAAPTTQAPTDAHPPTSASPITPPVNEPYFESAPEEFPVPPNQTPYNMTVNISMVVECRFLIAYTPKKPALPIGATFFGFNNTKVLLAYTRLEQAHGATLQVYDLATCKDSGVSPNDAISPDNLTQIHPSATLHTDLVWDSLPFANNIFNAHQTFGDSPGVRFWDIPIFNLADGTYFFWMANQSINVGVKSVNAPPGMNISATDYNSTFVQYAFNGSAIVEIGRSDPLECAPISSQAVPTHQPTLPNPPLNETTAWIICQYADPKDPIMVKYSLRALVISSPTVPPVTLTPIVATPDFEGFMASDVTDEISENDIEYLKPSERVDAPHLLRILPVNFAGTPPVDPPYHLNDSAPWFIDAAATLTNFVDSWSKATVTNFYIDYTSRRIYFGNSEAYYIVSITSDKRSVIFGEAYFPNSRIINSFAAWADFPGFSFLGDVQWIWVVSECVAGTELTDTGYCSKCSPGTFGIGCTLCPAGFVCDEFGLIVPNNLCPEGHYCQGGNSRSGRGYEPQLCRAGTYCPGGVTSPTPGSANSARLCTTGFYCPKGSASPTEQCPLVSTSAEGASSVDDCACDPGYIGHGGQCTPILSFASSNFDDQTKVRYMTYPVGFYPAGLGGPEGVRFYQSCVLNNEACNAQPQLTPSGTLEFQSLTTCNYTCGHSGGHHDPGGHDGGAPTGHWLVNRVSSWFWPKKNSGGGHHPDCIIECDMQYVCQEGYTDRLCSRCADGFYERGHTCLSCGSNSSSITTKTVFLFVILSIIVILLLALVIIGQAFIALILELLSMVVLNMIGLVPVWLLDVLVIFVLVYFINRGKRYNTLIKIQEDRAVRRKLLRRAKRLALKRREAQLHRATRLLNHLRGTSGTDSHSHVSQSHRALVLSANDEDALRSVMESEETRGALMLSPDEEDTIRQTLNDPNPRKTVVFGPVDMEELRSTIESEIDGDHTNPTRRSVMFSPHMLDALRTGEGGRPRRTVMFTASDAQMLRAQIDGQPDDEEDPPLPIEDDFVVLDTDDEDYLTEDGESELDDELDDGDEGEELTTIAEAEELSKLEEKYGVNVADIERSESSRRLSVYPPEFRRSVYVQPETTVVPASSKRLSAYPADKGGISSRRSSYLPEGVVEGRRPTLEVPQRTPVPSARLPGSQAGTSELKGILRSSSRNLASGNSSRSLHTSNRSGHLPHFSVSASDTAHYHESPTMSPDSTVDDTPLHTEDSSAPTDHGHDGDHGHGHGDGHGHDHEGHEPEYISEGLIKSFLFYLQTSEALTEGLFKWTQLLANLQELSPFSQLAIFDCLNRTLFSYESKFIMYILLIPALSLVMFLMYLLGLARMEIIRRRKLAAMKRDEKAQRRKSWFQLAWADEDEATPIRTGTTKEQIAELESKRRRLRYRWARVWLFFVSVFYFELTEGILKVFKCEMDEALELKFMESQPWIECNVHKSPYNVVFPLAIVGLFVYTVGVPVLFFWLLYHHRTRLHQPKVMSWLGMLYEEYQPHLWWFELTMIGRRILIAFIISWVPAENEFGPVMIMIILMAAMGTNIWFRAFVSDAENTVDLMAMCVMMITYLAGVVQRSNQNLISLQNLQRNTSPHHNSNTTAPHGFAPNLAPNTVEASAYRASWRSLPDLEIFIFVLNMAMFFIYLLALLRPRLQWFFEKAKAKWVSWRLARVEAKNAEIAAKNASFNMLINVNDDDEDFAPHRPLLTH